MPSNKSPREPESQRTKFENTARALGSDESEEKFDAALTQIARHKPSPEQGASPTMAKSETKKPAK